MVKFAGHFASACWWATFKCQDWWNAKRCCVKKPRSRRSQEEPGCTNFNRLLQCVKDVAENHKIVTLGCSSSKTVELCGQVFNLPSLEDLGLDRQRWLTPRIVEGFQVPWLGLDERSTPTIISRVKGFFVCQTIKHVMCFFLQILLLCWALRSFMIQSCVSSSTTSSIWIWLLKNVFNVELPKAHIIQILCIHRMWWI